MTIAAPRAGVAPNRQARVLTASAAACPRAAWPACSLAARACAAAGPRRPSPRSRPARSSAPRRSRAGCRRSCPGACGRPCSASASLAGRGRRPTEKDALPSTFAPATSASVPAHAFASSAGQLTRPSSSTLVHGRGAAHDLGAGALALGVEDVAGVDDRQCRRSVAFELSRWAPPSGRRRRRRRRAVVALQPEEQVVARVAVEEVVRLGVSGEHVVAALPPLMRSAIRLSPSPGKPSSATAVQAGDDLQLAREGSRCRSRPARRARRCRPCAKCPPPPDIDVVAVATGGSGRFRFRPSNESLSGPPVRMSSPSPPELESWTPGTLLKNVSSPPQAGAHEQARERSDRPGAPGPGGSKGQVTAAPPAFAQSGSAVAIPPVPESAIVIVVPSDEIVTWSSLASPVIVQRDAERARGVAHR